MDIISDLLNIPQEDILSSSSYRDEDGTLVINVTLVPKQLPCPACSCCTSHVKDYKIKSIKHSALNHNPCIIHYRARRYVCTVCGKTFFESNPFTPVGNIVSNLTLLNVLKELKESNSTFASVARHNYISPTKVQEIFDLYVRIKRKSFPEIICIDEVYAMKDNHSKYVCLLLDFKTHELIDMLPERKKYSLLSYFEKIPVSEKSNVRYFIMDMYAVYRDVVHFRFPRANIAVDSFHVVKNINDALNAVRIRIMKGYDSKSIEYYLLKNFNWFLLEKEVREGKRKYNKRLNQYINYPQLLDRVLSISSELREAYHIKDLYLIFNTCSDFANAEKDFNDVMISIRRTHIQEMVDIYKMLNNWKDEIINSFIIVNGRRLSNGIMESRNSIVKLIKKTGNGYVNFARFRNRCMYCMNKDALPSLSDAQIPIKMKGKKRGSYKK